MWEENGYLHQMPFTYYTQEGKLDLPQVLKMEIIHAFPEKLD